MTDTGRMELQTAVAAASAGWLAAASLVGALLAALLVFPAWGAAMGEWTYGRWEPLHLNWQLYGWCSLPWVGLLLKRYAAGVRHARGILALWSLALAAGGVSWLQGESSGKLFLDWTGLPLVIFTGVLGILWCLLAWQFFSRRNAIDAALLAALAFVPGILFWAAGRRVYPEFDPGTGGPTGASLLGSTLAVILMIGGLPELLGVARRAGYRPAAFWIWFALDCGIWASLDHGNTSHRQWTQFAGLGSLVIWIPVLSWHLRRFEWLPASKPWLHATEFWWALLVISGCGSFLPGVLDHFKFTHALVAHAHLAMAGLLTSVNMLILTNLSPRPAPAMAPLLNRAAFYCWQAGLLMHLGALGALAEFEIARPGQLYVFGNPLLFRARLHAGLLMAAVAVYWAVGIWRLLPAYEQPG
jgi:cytochrome c oxidase cbb3-type subunit 1